MSFRNLFVAVSLFVTAAVSVGAHADDFDKRVTFTAAQPFVVPGAKYTNNQTYIPAGTYNIRFMHDPNPQNVAYIFDRNNQYLVATAIPVKYSFPDGRATDGAYDQLIQFKPSKDVRGYMRLSLWLYPGDTGGWEFVER